MERLDLGAMPPVRRRPIADSHDDMGVTRMQARPGAQIAGLLVDQRDLGPAQAVRSVDTGVQVTRPCDDRLRRVL